MLAALDEAIIHYMQEGYLWLFDRTGIFIGSLMVANTGIVVAVALTANDAVWWRVLIAIVGLCWLFFAFAHWNAQATLSNESGIANASCRGARARNRIAKSAGVASTTSRGRISIRQAADWPGAQPAIANGSARRSCTGFSGANGASAS